MGNTVGGEEVEQYSSEKEAKNSRRESAKIRYPSDPEPGVIAIKPDRFSLIFGAEPQYAVADPWPLNIMSTVEIE